ncbi:MAG: hypothetical protein V3T22_03825, partial [Planctomycetota bacterium]
LASLLRELGFSVEVWTGAPGALPAGGGLLWMACAPRAFAGGGDQDPVGNQGPVGNLHDAGHYRSFCENGGVLLLPAAGSEDFLVEGLGLTALRGIEDALRDAAPAREVTLFEGPPNALQGAPARAFDPRLVHDELEFMLLDEQGDPLAVELPLGRGRLVVLAADDFLDNERLALGDHAVIAWRLAREFSRDGVVRFDEYALGAWKPLSTAALALGPRLFWLTLTVLLWLVLYCWRQAWVRGFPREPERLEALSPLTRARSVAGLHERARRLDLLAAGLVEGVLREIAAGLRLPRSLQAAEPHELLESLADHLDARDLLPGWRAELLGPRVLRPQDLQRLERVLDSIAARSRGHDETEGDDE